MGPGHTELMLWELLSVGKDGQQGAVCAGVEIWDSLEFSALILLLVVWSSVEKWGVGVCCRTLQKGALEPSGFAVAVKQGEEKLRRQGA